MNNKWTFSLISWIITTMVVVVVLLPIYSQIGDSYQFYIENIAFIIIFLTFARFIFLTKHHWFSHTSWFKAIAIFAVIPVLFYLVDNLWDFQRFLDEEGIGSILQDIPASRQSSLAKYIKAEMVFFWSAAFVSSVALPMRMLHSLWRLRHRGKV